MPQTAEFTRLLADARTHLPGAIIDGIAAELFSSIRDFLDFTNLWQEEIDVAIVANSRTYVITPADDGRINRLLNLYNSTDPDKRPVAPVRMDAPGTLVLGVTPQEPVTWVAVVSKVITDQTDADGVLIPNTAPIAPNWVVQKYWNALLWGTLGRMQMQGGKPWSNTQTGINWSRMFLAEKTKARVDGLVGNVRGQPTWSFPSFAGGSQRRVG